MQGNLKKNGHYELFETSKGHQILNLNDKDFYAVVEGQKGDILVHSDAGHNKKRTVNKGKFYLADFDDDPEFNDIPHLFLQDGKSRYREWILPRGVPTSSDHQKKLIRRDTTVGADKVEYHTEGSGNKGREKKYQNTKKHASSRAEAAGKSSLGEKSKTELYELAKRKEIPGRSKLNKQQLVDALSSNN